MKKNLLIFLGTSIVMLLFCEVVLRFRGYHLYSFRPDWLAPSPYVVKESNLQRKGRSLSWYRSAFRRPSKSTRRNGLHVEEDYYPYKKNPKKRILAIGDSGTFGQGVKRNQAWPKALENSMNQRKGDQVEVFNFGVPGALVSDSLYYLRHFLLDYSPDTIIVCLFMANDINQSIYFDELLFKQALHIESLPSSFIKSLALYKAAQLAFIKDFKAKEGFSNYEEVVFQRGVRKKELFAGDFLEGEFLTYEKEPRAQINKAYANFEKLIDYFKKSAEAVGARLVFTAIPSRSFLEDSFNIQPWDSLRHGSPKTFFEPFGISSFENLDFSVPYKRLRRVFSKNRVEYFDFSNELKLLNKTQPILLKGDDHLNPYGHRQLARLINQSL